jgi:hypothetical protein
MKKADDEPKAKTQRPRCDDAATPESAWEMKMPWGRCKSLKRLDQRKTNAWISFLVSLDLLPKKLGFPSGFPWTSFRALEP